MRVLCVRCRVLRSSPPYGVPLPCLHSVRTASPQPCFPLRRACRRVRPHRSTIGRLPSGASASLRHRSAQRPLGCRGRCGARLARARWRLWDGSPLRHRGFRFSPRCAIHPRMRLAWLGRDTSLRPATPSRGDLRIPAQNPLWPRGHRRPSRPRYSQNVGASVAACTSRSAPSMSFAPSWRACAYLARSEAWRRRHEAEQAQTAGRARRRDCACAARREVFRPSASLRRRGWIARLTADARAVAGGAPPKRLPKLSADRMCWAGNAAAVSRARCARSAGLRRTRARTQSSDCGAARGLSKTALIAWRVRLRRHFPRTDLQTHTIRTPRRTHHTAHHDARTRASAPTTWHPQNTLPKITSPP